MKPLRFLSRRRCPPRHPECLDIFDPVQLRAVAAERDESLPHWSAADAEKSVEGASRMILGLLRDKRRLRWQFPAAISGGETGAYFQWLTRAPKLKLSAHALECIRAAFQIEPGKRVFELFLHSPDLQQRFPYGLLTAGQKKFARWLLREGRERFRITSAEALWFLHSTREQAEDMLCFTWLLRPSWQAEFPLGLTKAGRDEFYRWLQREFEGCPGFTRVKGLPVLPPATSPDPGLTSEGEPLGVNLLSHFCYPSGLQQAALNLRGALEHAGWRTSSRDVPTSPVTDLLDRTPFLGLELHPITILNAAPVPHFHDAYERSGLWRREGIYRIAYWNWELEEIPDEWADLAPLLDEIWAPTPFVAEAFRKRMPLPVYQVLPGLEINEITPMAKSSLGIPEENYVFLFMFDMSSEMERKNPLAVIRAFRAAFPDRTDVSLVLKISRGATKPEALAQIQIAARAAGAIVIDGLVPHPQAHGFLQMCDCFVSLHRSEGFGLCLAEAMLLGKPVIGTNYSGNLAFMHPGNSLLVDYELTEIREDMPVYKKGNRWAEPSLDHAVAQMKYCAENRNEGANLGAVAQAEMREKFSLAAMARRVVGELRRIKP